MLRGAFLLFCLLAVSLNAAAQGQKVTLKLSNAALSSALRQVEQQSGYYKINYARDDVRGYLVSAEIQNAEAMDAVRTLLNGLPLKATANGRFIQISREQDAARQTGGSLTVRGRVVDADGEPLPGVTVMKPGTQIVTTTDIDGYYALSGVGPDDLIQYSYIGKQTLERRASSKESVIILEDEYNLLKEVVVTGYQTMKKEDATGSLQKITALELDKRYSTSLLENLEGQIPGLMRYSTGLNGEGESTMSIRGIATFQASSKPLVVVDGLPIEGSLESLNPYDIASVSILKDAAAASIYGARASNGVIVVVTKRASSAGRTEVSFNSALTVAEKQTFDNYRYVGSSDAVDTEIKVFEDVFNDPMGAMYESFYWPAYASYYSPVGVAYMNHRTGAMSDADYQAALSRYRNNNYLEEYRNIALRPMVTQQYNLAVRSMSDRSNSNITFDYKRNNQGFAQEHDQIFNFGFNGEYKIAKWMDLAFGINANFGDRKIHFEPTQASYLRSPYNFATYLSMYNSDGTPAYLKAAVDPDDPMFSDASLGMKYLGYNLEEQLAYNFQRREQTNLRSYVHAKFNITDWLKVSSMFQYERLKTATEAYIEKDSYAQNYIYDLYTSGGTHYLPDAGILDAGTTSGNYYTFRSQADFNKTFADKHAVSAIAGLEVRETNFRTLNNKLLGYDDNTQTNAMSTLNIYDLSRLASSDLYASMGRIAPSNFYSILYKGGYYDGSAFSTGDVRHRFVSLYTTVNYTYDHRYSLSGSFRKDQTDLFGADPKYRGRPLWSFGASWNMHNEAFLKDSRTVNMLKLRLSYGLTGNIDSSVSSYLVGRIANNTVAGGKYAYLVTPPNDELRWEKTASWNFGVDYALFDNRLYGALDLYSKYSSDILSHTELDPSEGFTSLVINNGEASNRGVELQLNAIVVRPRRPGGLEFDVAYNVAYNKNRVEKVTYSPGALTILGWGQSSHALVEGNPINSLYAVGYAGHDDSGMTQWYHADGTPTVESLYSNIKAEDVKFMGSLDPTLTMSLSPSLSFRGFTLSAMVAYYGGHVMRARTNDWLISSSLTGYGNVPAALYEYYQDPDNYELPLPTVGNYLNSNNSGQALEYFDKAVVPADFMKLRNVVLGYTIPKSFCTKLGLQSARLRFQANNVATWVKNDLGVDPEANNPWTGFDINRPMRSYTMSLNINF